MVWSAADFDSALEIAQVIFSGGNATVSNSGSNTNGIVVRTFAGGNATASNFGSNTGGIFAQVTGGGGNATVINSGSTTGLVLLSAIGSGTSTLTNSGLISNPGGIAIQFQGGPATLNLLPGSIIVGGINLLASSHTINFRTSNQNLTFDTLAGARITSTVPFAVSGNRVATIDPTPIAMTDRNLMDFTRAVSNAVRCGHGADGGAHRVARFIFTTEHNAINAAGTGGLVPGTARGRMKCPEQPPRWEFRSIGRS